MAGPLIGEILAQGYSTGRAIGNDFSQMRYRRGESRLRERYAAEAQAAGVPLEQYLAQKSEGQNEVRMAQLENELSQLYQTSGALKRGVTTDRGISLADDSRSTLHTDFSRNANRNAGFQAIEGDIAGSQRRLAGAGAAMGDYDSALKHSTSALRVDNSTAALRPDGSFDSNKAFIGEGQISARMGDAAGANTNMEAARDMRFKFVAHQSGQLLAMLQNAGAYSPEKISGVANAVLSHVGELGSGLVTSIDAEGDVWIAKQGAEGEKPVGYIELTKNGKPTDQALQFLQSMQTDPRGVIDAQVAQLTSANAAATKRMEGIFDKVLDAQLTVAKDLAKVDPAAGAASARYATAMGDVAKGGFTPTKLDDGSIMLTDKQNRVFILTPGTGAIDPTTGQRERPMTVKLPDGRSVSPEQMQGAPNEVMQLVQAQIAFDAAAAQTNVQVRAQMAQMGLGLITEIGRQAGLPTNDVGGALGGGGGEPQGDTPRFPIKETDDYVRKISANLPTLSGTNREKAGQMMAALVKQESGGDHSAVSPKGARGVTQVMPKTGVDPGFGVKPLQNDSREEYMRFGQDYLTAMLDRYKGDPRLALAAYNAGPGKVDAWIADKRIRPAANVAAMGSVDTPKATATASAAVAPKGAISTTPTGLKRTEASVPDPAAQLRMDRRELLNEKMNLELALKAFDRNEKPTDDVGTETPSGAIVYSRTLSPAQTRARSDLVRRIALVNEGLQGINKATVTRKQTAANDAETKRVQRYGAAPDDVRKAALLRWTTQ